MKRIQSYRAKTFRLLPRLRISSKEEAINFANQRGFIFFWPIKGILLPSLWVAVAGDRPVADEHDDPGHITWGWKDSLLGARHWYYAKVLRKRATITSLDAAPYFYALSRNFGSPEHDYLTLYEQGRLTQEAKAVYEALLTQGSLDTVALRRATRLMSRESDYRFNRALTELQADFKILPVGVTRSGGWRYAFAYDLVTRHYPNLINQSRFIDEKQAREKLTELYFRSVGAAQINDIRKLFGWHPTDVISAVDGLIHMDILQRVFQPEDKPGEWIVLTELM